MACVPSQRILRVFLRNVHAISFQDSSGFFISDSFFHWKDKNNIHPYDRIINEKLHCSGKGNTHLTSLSLSVHREMLLFQPYHSPQLTKTT